jgi:mono/diheme cytochrome c family protein
MASLRQVKGTKVLSVQKAQPVPGDGHQLENRTENGENKRVHQDVRTGGKVKRFLSIVSFAALCSALVLTASVVAQNSGKKSPSGNAAAVGRGKSLFQQKCSVCHYDTSDQKKIGPGLKGLSKRGTFTVNGNKITDENLKNWIENGDQLMPPFKEVLEEGQVKEVIAYVKTL